MRAYGKQTKGLEDPRDIPGVGAVKAQRRQTQAADNKESVRHIVAKNLRQEQRKAGEQRLREEQRHQCAKGRYKEGKTHDRAVSLPHAQRDQKQIDVAQVQRQLIENAEAIGIVRTDIRYVHGQRELVAGKQHEIKKAHADQKPGATCFRFLRSSKNMSSAATAVSKSRSRCSPRKGVIENSFISHAGTSFRSSPQEIV